MPGAENRDRGDESITQKYFRAEDVYGMLDSKCTSGFQNEVNPLQSASHERGVYSFFRPIQGNDVILTGIGRIMIVH